MSHYAKGTRFEHRVRTHLTKQGYEVVRAAGSKGGTKADLLAFKPGQLLLVQCKTDGVLAPAEWDRLFEVAGWVEGAVPILASVNEKRAIVLTRLLSPKRRNKRVQDVEPFVIDEVAR